MSAQTLWWIAFLGAWLALNVWMTRRVLRAPDEHLHHKKLLVAGIWIIPFMGAFTARNQLRACVPEAAPPAPRKPSHEQAEADVEPAPDRVAAPGMESFPLVEHTAAAHGFPLVDWTAAAAWVAGGQLAAEQVATASAALRRAWLLHMRDVLGPGFYLHESDDALVLSSLEPNVVQATARFIAKARRRVAAVLRELCAFPEGQKSILIVFDDEESYYAYVSAYYAEDGEFAFSGGMFINAGCPHFVTRRADLTQIEPVIAHELTHSAVSHLRLPLWLDEGIAVNTEHRVVGAQRGLYTPHELHAMHLRFWGEQEIQQFWSGESFHRPDDGQLLSYELARIIVDALGKDWESFERFVADARSEDAGQAAALQHLGIDLGECVSALLQREATGSWAPRLETPLAEPADASLARA